MGNQIIGSSLKPGEEMPKRISPQAKALIRQLRKEVTMNKLKNVLSDYQRNYAPKEIFQYDEFDDLMSPMINNPAHLFEFLREGHSIILPEAFIALVFFCQEGDYDDRI